MTAVACIVTAILVYPAELTVLLTFDACIIGLDSPSYYKTYTSIFRGLVQPQICLFFKKGHFERMGLIRESYVRPGKTQLFSDVFAGRVPQRVPVYPIFPREFALQYAGKDLVDSH
jgi:hypothetical protein